MHDATNTAGAGAAACMCVDKDAPMTTAIVEADPAPQLEDGQICVHVCKLVVTANTLTYALAGKHPVLKYFQNFVTPQCAPDSLAMCPC